MAIKGAIGGSGELLVGEDKILRLELLNAAETEAVDMTGWAISFVVREQVASTAVLTKTATIAGAYNVSPGVNAQRATVTLSDTDLTIDSGVYLYSWKRTDDGFEAVLRYGTMVVEQTTQA